jgi:hypothetical protein
MRRGPESWGRRGEEVGGMAVVVLKVELEIEMNGFGGVVLRGAEMWSLACPDLEFIRSTILFIPWSILASIERA